MQISQRIKEVKQDILCSGLMTKVSMKDMYKTIPQVLNEYMKCCGKQLNPNIKRPWQYVSLSTNYEENLSWDYYTGHVVEEYENEPAGLIHYSIPKGDYAVIEVREKKAMFFPIKMGRIKKYIYTKWLPQSEYQFSGYEFEYSDEAMKKANPQFIDLYIGIKRK